MKNDRLEPTTHRPISSSSDLCRLKAVEKRSASEMTGCLRLNAPPKSGPAIAEQLQVMLKACDHFARDRSSTISDVMVHTRLTIPPPPIPASARAMISHSMLWEPPQRRDPVRNMITLLYNTVYGDQASGPRFTRSITKKG